MAKDEVVRRRKRSRNGLGGYRDGGKGSQKGKVLATPFASKSGTVGKGPETIEKLRKARLSHLEKSPDELRMLSMRYLGESVHREVSTDAPIRKIATKPSHRSASESKRRRHRKPRSTEGSVDDKEYVYGQSQAKNPEPNSKSKYIKSSARVLPTVVEEAEAPAPQARKQSRQRHATDHSVEQDVTSGTSNSGSSTINVRNKTQRRESDPIRSLSVPAQRPPSPPRRHSSSVRRTSSTRGSEYSSPPRVWRSSTSVPPRQESATRIPPKRSLSTASVTTKSERRSTSILGTFLKGPGQVPPPAEKRVTCLTCLDDIGLSKTAKLACAHRMCHTCLKRIFTMSVTDPAHMPPKCCTSEHIPLKHVDKLFDQKFKVAWNRKFTEYTTRNRIYCPSKGCGEWIKPNHITIEQGRKVGKCKKCGIKVCGTCNNRMHTSKECPKDEATKQFVEIAKREGWQKCYNCKAMVELKEGCNHMTCRCTAEFCMICGNKWKTCDCPWFNYEAVEADRLLHMNIGQARRVYADGGGRAPLRYQEEMDRRREQEQRDEVIARRMQVLGLDEAPNDMAGYNNAYHETVGIGNAAGHFLNQDFRHQPNDFPSGNLQQAAQVTIEGLFTGGIHGRENPLPPPPFEILPQPPPPPHSHPHPLPLPLNTDQINRPDRLLRQHSAASRAYNNAPSTRPSERVIPRRRATDYSAEAARHRPISGRPPAALQPDNAASPQVMAARRASLRRSATTGPPRPSSRRVSAIAEMVATDQVTMDETDNRIENWMRGVPTGEPGPETQVDEDEDDEDDDDDDVGR